MRRTGLSQPNTSMHLGCLAECGLVTWEREGKFVYYEIADKRAVKLLDQAEELLLQVAPLIAACPAIVSRRALGRPGRVEEAGALTETLELTVARAGLRRRGAADRSSACCAQVITHRGGPDMITSVVTGGAGFLGSHLCDELLRRDHRVICLDNLDTGTLENIEHLRDSAFTFHNVDVAEEDANVDGDVDFVFHLASPASPIDYQRLPLHTLKVGSYGTHHCLGLAKFKRARFLLASTSEVYGDPLQHPQTESYSVGTSTLSARAGSTTRRSGTVRLSQWPTTASRAWTRA